MVTRWILRFQTALLVDQTLLSHQRDDAILLRPIAELNIEATGVLRSRRAGGRSRHVFLQARRFALEGDVFFDDRIELVIARRPRLVGDHGTTVERTARCRRAVRSGLERKAYEPSGAGGHRAVISDAGYVHDDTLLVAAQETPYALHIFILIQKFRRRQHLRRRRRITDEIRLWRIVADVHLHRAVGKEPFQAAIEIAVRLGFCRWERLWRPRARTRSGCRCRGRRYLDGTRRRRFGRRLERYAPARCEGLRSGARVLTVLRRGFGRAGGRRTGNSRDRFLRRRTSLCDRPGRRGCGCFRRCSGRSTRGRHGGFRWQGGRCRTWLDGFVGRLCRGGDRWFRRRSRGRRRNRRRRGCDALRRNERGRRRNAHRNARNLLGRRSHDGYLAWIGIGREGSHRRGSRVRRRMRILFCEHVALRHGRVTGENRPCTQSADFWSMRHGRLHGGWNAFRSLRHVHARDDDDR